MQNTDSDGKSLSFQEIIKTWTERLIKAQIPKAEWSVNKIVAHILGKKDKQGVDMKSVPTETTLSKIEEMCGERLKGTPVPFILGQCDFLDMTLLMKQPVLIPRPETEEFAKIIIKEWPFDQEREVKVLEVGCGAGVLAVYILHKLPNVKCVAMDISKPSCELTMDNAKRYNLQDRIEVIHGDILTDSVVSELSQRGPYDVVLSNPPYLTTEEISELDNEIVQFEDHDALFGGNDGLDVVRKVIVESGKFFKDENSVILLKVGSWLTERIKTFLEERSDLRLSYTDKGSAGRVQFCQMKLIK
ncbi:MTRF1L release factor glutamine methyltransferase-like [Ruditapes philippinarum]|uniref:MTRF1L release factor glutamine methyltransferase-like n=1 Tax=Ruditapes philippinarum TaxID=129788 RepID=UPI00295B0467|nr:MTRF1L release factor glutamine methyltransferase-like [Ruditapes philippinarum]